MKWIRDEIDGLVRSFGYHPWNSNVKKTAMYVTLALFSFLAVRVTLQQVDLSDPGILTLWTLLASSFTFLLGKNQEGEVRHRRRQRGDPEE